MSGTTHTCAYKYCLHHGEEVKSPNAVVLNKKWYHADCAKMHKSIQRLAYMYTSFFENKDRYPLAYTVISNMAINSQVPLDYIYKMIKGHGKFYRERQVYALYGIRTMFWTKEMVDNVGNNNRQGTN